MGPYSAGHNPECRGIEEKFKKHSADVEHMSKPSIPLSVTEKTKLHVDNTVQSVPGKSHTNGGGEHHEDNLCYIYNYRSMNTPSRPLTIRTQIKHDGRDECSRESGIYGELVNTHMKDSDETSTQNTDDISGHHRQCVDTLRSQLPEDFLFQYQPICISQRAVPHLRSYSADEEVNAQKKLLDESLKKEMNKLSTSFNTDGPERSTTLQNHTTTDFYRLEKEVKDLQIKCRALVSEMEELRKTMAEKDVLMKSTERQLHDAHQRYDEKVANEQILESQMSVMTEKLRRADNTLSDMKMQLAETRLQKHEPETIDSVGTTIAADNEKVKYELRDLKSRYDDLKKQCYELKTQVQQSNAMLVEKDNHNSLLDKQLQDTHKKYEEKLSDLEREIADLRQELSDTTKTMEMTKTNFNEKNKELVELQQKSEKHADLVMEHAELQRKHNDLVKIHGKALAKDVAKDERNSENINEQCRPSVLAEKYAQLSFQTVSNLKDTFTKPDSVPKLLWNQFIAEFFCLIFMTGEKEMHQAYHPNMSRLTRWLNDPLADPVIMEEERAETQAALPQSIEHEIVQALRARSDKVSIRQHAQVVLTKVKQALSSGASITRDDDIMSKMMDSLSSTIGQDKEEKIVKFVNEVCILAWKMTIQRPPMRFETPGIDCAPNTDLHDPIPTAGDIRDPEQMVVHFYLEPVLMHGDRVLRKARVVLHDKPL